MEIDPKLKETEAAEAINAEQELMRFKKEVSDLVFAIEAYMEPRELTLGHFNEAVEAFNRRNQVVIPELKMKAVKDLFEKITN